ncbi:MAG: hypothetical protein ACFFDN_27535 [Candidatus Hodarchaeota archaeon]
MKQEIIEQEIIQAPHINSYFRLREIACENRLIREYRFACLKVFLLKHDFHPIEKKYVDTFMFQLNLIKSTFIPQEKFKRFTYNEEVESQTLINILSEWYRCSKEEDTINADLWQRLYIEFFLYLFFSIKNPIKIIEDLESVEKQLKENMDETDDIFEKFSADVVLIYISITIKILQKFCKLDETIDEFIINKVLSNPDLRKNALLYLLVCKNMGGCLDSKILELVKRTSNPRIDIKQLCDLKVLSKIGTIRRDSIWVVYPIINYFPSMEDSFINITKKIDK